MIINKAKYFLIFICIFQGCQLFKTHTMDYKLDFYTSHHQFYICDKLSPGSTDSDNFWTDSAHKDRLALEEGIIGIGTECYGPVKTEIIILDKSNNAFNSDLYDHIVEGGLNLKSGVLQIMDCPDFNSELDIDLKPGKYRVRVYSSNLASVLGDEGNDFYRIEVWPSDTLERKVLKRYKN